MRFLALGGVIGLLVLLAAAAMGGSPRHVAAGPGRAMEGAAPNLSLDRHTLRGGIAELQLAARSSSVFAFDEGLWPTEPWAPAARDATESGRWVGVGAGVATAVLPGPGARPLRVRVTVAKTEPPVRRGDDHVVDLDLALPSGRLVLTGTGSIAAHSVAVPPGVYRVRFAGEGYRVAAGAARLRIELWPREAAQPPTVRRAWPGWNPQPA